MKEHDFLKEVLQDEIPDVEEIKKKVLHTEVRPKKSRLKKLVPLATALVLVLGIYIAKSNETVFETRDKSADIKNASSEEKVEDQIPYSADLQSDEALDLENPSSWDFQEISKEDLPKPLTGRLNDQFFDEVGFAEVEGEGIYRLTKFTEKGIFQTYLSKGDLILTDNFPLTEEGLSTSPLQKIEGGYYTQFKMDDYFIRSNCEGETEQEFLNYLNSLLYE